MNSGRILGPGKFFILLYSCCDHVSTQSLLSPSGRCHVRQSMPLRLAGDEGYHLSAAAWRARGWISHKARSLIGIFGLARESLPQRAAVSTAALSAAAIVLSGVPPQKTKPAAEAAGSLSI